jgi:hypothetical protein
VIGFDRVDGMDLLDLAEVRHAAAGCGALVHLGAQWGGPADLSVWL